MTEQKKYNTDGKTSEDRALDLFADMMIERIKSLSSKDGWKKPWFTEGSLSWPKNLSGREYNGMNALMLMMHCEKNGYKLPIFCTFDRVAGLNFTKDKQGKRQQAKGSGGEALPQVSILKGEKSFPIFITTFTVVDKETKAVAAASLSPMLKQFYDLKAKHPDAILLFRCGDFYETYCNDAEKASKILGITLTRSNRTKDIEGKPLSMAGFPYHALDTYLPKLIRAGERVAICDQLEAPKRNQESAENQVVESARQEESKSSGRHR